MGEIIYIQKVIIKTIPAVLHQVQDNLVQELLHQCSSDPQVFQCLRREVGQLGLPTAVITQ